jgi:hypothetical protein
LLMDRIGYRTNRSLAVAAPCRAFVPN